MMAGDLSSPFPVWALLPKRETNVSDFLNKYPKYDGRGVTIAILDSGIDPGAPGLQKTSDGKVKIIEMMDATGAGDVDTSAIVEAADGVITGLSGRILKIPTSWKNPSGKYHIGVKNAYELYCKQLKDRMTKDYKDKQWDPHHKLLQADVSRKVQEFNDQNANVTEVSQSLKFQKEDLESLLDVANNLEKKYTDGGPVYDCVVFHDGTLWRAVLDTSENGDLESCILLGTYAETQEYATLTAIDRLNYTINVHEDGNLLEIVSTSTAHGTHVASIATACFPEEQDKNGIAPGAQVVSINIGDNRLGSMETGTALMRAFIKVISMRCDVINMSYGEHAHWTGGRVLDLLHEVVDKYGTIMVTSAGNRGPALSSLGTPAVMHTCSTMSIGAYVSPDMMLAEYTLLQKAPGLGYTWTSRGPGLNGDLGVSVCAPGGAITSVPNWMLKGSLMMNGTSMSSPHVAGCVCVLLSALKAKQIPYSPYSVRRAVEHTALKMSTFDPFSMGHGLIQVCKAFDHLSDYKDSVEQDIRFVVTCNNNGPGIYLRESYKTKIPSVVVICVEPIFLDASNADADRKIEFHMNLTLTSEVPWVSVPPHFSLMYSARNFVVRVDPTGLPPGEHFTWIKAFDSTCIEKGPVFCIPVTVIRSQKVEDRVHWKLDFPKRQLEPGKVVREFIEVPTGATWAVFWMTSHHAKYTGTVIVHGIQLRPQMSCKEFEFYKACRLGPLEETVQSFAVWEHAVLELAVVQYWTNWEPLPVDYSLTFHGLRPESGHISMHAGDGIQKVDILSLLSYEEVAPAAVLKQHVMVLKPSENRLGPLRARDVIREGRQIYELVLTYPFGLHKAAEVTPSFQLLCELLYESQFESQLWMLFDANKQLMASGDAYPSKYSKKLEKGDYILKIQIRHEQRVLLERLVNTPLLISSKLQSNICMDVYDKHSLALVNGKKMANQSLLPGSCLPLYLAPISTDKYPKNCSPGHYLSGQLTLSKDETVKKTVSYPLKYIVADHPKKPASPKLESKRKTRTLEEEFSEEVKQLKLAWISKLTGKVSKDLFEETLASEKETHWPILLARIQSLDNDDERNSYLLEIISLADKILGMIDTVDVLASVSCKGDKKDAAISKKLEQKSCIIDTLVQKGKAMCDYYMIPKSEPKEEEQQKSDAAPDSTTEKNPVEITLEKIDEVYLELQKWADMADIKVAPFTEKHAVAHKHFGRALKLLLKQLEERPTSKLDKKCISIFTELGWNHVANHFKRSLLVRYPLSYRLF